jgi:hypothetical protein
MYTTLAAVDIIGFGSRYVAVDAQAQARQRMHELLLETFSITGLSWWDCHREGRGDGILIVVPPDVNPDRLLDPFAHHLNALLAFANRRASDTTRLQLRIAVHHGCISYDAHGVTGYNIVHLFRLLDGPAFKKAVRAARADLGLIVSDRLYSDATERSGLVNPGAYRRIRIACKETHTQAWLWLPSMSY